MGNAKSEPCEQSSAEADLWWTSGSDRQVKRPELTDEISALRRRRMDVIEAKRKEMDELRRENTELKQLLKQRNGSFEVPGVNVETELAKLKEVNDKLQRELSEVQKQLDEATSSLSSERLEYKNHVVALKDVIVVSKQLVLIRDDENKQLASKLEEIQSTLSQKELETFSEDLRKEYERQLTNMKRLKTCYEESQRTARLEYNKVRHELGEAKHALSSQEAKNTELEERVRELEETNSNQYDSIKDLESHLGLSKAECAELRAEMAVINQLFSQILLGFNNGTDIDLDNLIKLLEENHALLTDIVVNEECSVMSSALPKVLLDLIHQVNEKNKPGTNLDMEVTEAQNISQQNTISSAAEIVENLPKVWRVLIELLSHQTTFKNEDNEEHDKNPCYKSVETPTGSKLVLSVSKTFIRLKDLIVQKKLLEKETMRLKQLNTHLEVRLQDQEKRLEEVSHEVANTWHVVGKMQKQHQQLHTHKMVLRYELSQKRKLLNGLKLELEDCKEKCLQAHEKNSSTEELWRQLRDEFASRRAANLNEDVNNSMESGYSDDRESSSGDEDEDVDNPTILDVIKDEITKIECTSDKNDVCQDPESESSIVNNSSASDTVVDIEESSNDNQETYKKLEDDVLESIKLAKECNGGNSSQESTCVEEAVVQSTHEEFLARREERLKRLEEEAQQLVGKVLKNANRGTEFHKTLTKLHDKYGSTSTSATETDTKDEKQS